MDNETVLKLMELNRQFYNAFASSFARSRAESEPGLERLLRHVQPEDRVLDLGCGNGRIAQLLPPGVAYTGMDYAEGMLEEARRSACEKGLSAIFVQGNLLSGVWPGIISSTMYDWIFLRAVLHHIPAYQNRASIVRTAAQRLATDGQLILANWQFMNIERLRKRVLPWEVVHLKAAQVEANDYLLDWQRDGYAIRYVHLIDETETRRLALDGGLSVVDLFLADGHTNDLTLYAQLQKLAPGE